MSARTTTPADVRPAAQTDLLAWYARNGRSLAFRGTRDPYAILVSEVMAQQTQVGRVEEAWRRFLDRFPTVEALSAASTADVLRGWQGLGYNRRALNLRRAAAEIVARGGFPTTVDELVTLPGIGPYTARAVAAIAFGQPVAAVDVNVARVVGRYSRGRGTPFSRAELQRAADALVPGDRAADWTHALMDLGSLVCRPGRPDCPNCPLVESCRFAAETIRLAAKRTARSAPAPRPGRAAPARPSMSFPASRRWLRGHIVRELSATEGGRYVRFEPPVGVHEEGDVARAIAALAREGLVEVSPVDSLAARLPDQVAGSSG